MGGTETPEKFSIVAQDLFGFFPRHQAPIDLNPTRARHDVDLCTALNQTYVEGRTADERMLEALQMRAVFLKEADKTSHVFDGIRAQMGVRAVGSLPLHNDTPAQTTFAGDDHLHFCWLGNYGGGSLQIFAQLQHAWKGMLLSHGRDDPYFTARLLA